MSCIQKNTENIVNSYGANAVLTTKVENNEHSYVTKLIEW